jgi:hypothetical protein
VDPEELAAPDELAEPEELWEPDELAVPDELEPPYSPFGPDELFEPDEPEAPDELDELVVPPSEFSFGGPALLSLEHAANPKTATPSAESRIVRTAMSFLCFLGV